MHSCYRALFKLVVYHSFPKSAGPGTTSMVNCELPVLVMTDSLLLNMAKNWLSNRWWKPMKNGGSFHSFWYVYRKATTVRLSTGWWFGTFFIFPNSWDDDPIWLSYFSGGWLNHQLVNQYTRRNQAGEECRRLNAEDATWVIVGVQLWPDEKLFYIIMLLWN